VLIALPRREILLAAVPLQHRLVGDDAGVERDERVRDLEGRGRERAPIAFLAAEGGLAADKAARRRHIRPQRSRAEARQRRPTRGPEQARASACGRAYHHPLEVRMRRLVASGLILVSSAAIATIGGSRPHAQAQPIADLILVNGTVLTVDPGDRARQADRRRRRENHRRRHERSRPSPRGRHDAGDRSRRPDTQRRG